MSVKPKLDADGKLYYADATGRFIINPETNEKVHAGLNGGMKSVFDLFDQCLHPEKYIVSDEVPEEQPVNDEPIPVTPGHYTVAQNGYTTTVVPPPSEIAMAALIDAMATTGEVPSGVFNQPNFSKIFTPESDLIRTAHLSYKSWQ